MSLKEILDATRQLIRAIEADDGLAGRESGAPRIMFSRADLGGISLYGDLATEYQRNLRDLYALVARKQVLGLRAVEALLQTAILTALDITKKQPGQSFEQRLEQAIAVLQQSTQATPDEWQLHFRVMGIAPQGLPITLGNMRLYHATEDSLRHEVDRLNSYIDSTKNMPNEKQALKDVIGSEVGKGLRGTVMAAVEVKAIDEDAAEAIATRDLRLILDVINFYADVIHPPGVRARAYLPGDASSVIDVSFGYHMSAQPSGYLSNVKRGPLEAISLVELTPKLAERNGFGRIKDILASTERNSFERRLLTAFRWAGRATVTERREDAFLLYAVALESLLLPTEQSAELSYRLRLRCAHLLGLTPEARERLVKRVGRLYGLRSRIVHSGSIDVTDADLSEIRHLAKNAIVALLVEPDFQAMNNENDLEQWFERKLLGGFQA
jgi:hypothetical protein